MELFQNDTISHFLINSQWNPIVNGDPMCRLDGRESEL